MQVYDISTLASIFRHGNNVCLLNTEYGHNSGVCYTTNGLLGHDAKSSSGTSMLQCSPTPSLFFVAGASEDAWLLQSHMNDFTLSFWWFLPILTYLL